MFIYRDYFLTSMISSWLTLRYLVRRRESLKGIFIYIKKSINLSLCYIEFFNNRTFKNIVKNSQAAFSCSIYDYATDYKVGELEYQLFLEEISKFCSPKLVSLVKDLRSKEINNLLTDDGLERGIISLDFIIGHIGIESEWDVNFKLNNKNDIGLALQLIDDVLDYHEDKAYKHLNCLIVGNKQEYIQTIPLKIDLLRNLPLFMNPKKAPVMNKIFNIVIDKALPSLS